MHGLTEDQLAGEHREHTSGKRQIRLCPGTPRRMVLYESERFIALASEEVAIRSVLPDEIDTCDPYDGEVRVWQS